MKPAKPKYLIYYYQQWLWWYGGGCGSGVGDGNDKIKQQQHASRGIYKKVFFALLPWT